MRITRRWFWATALVPLSLLITGGMVYAAHPTVRWDIVSIQPPNVVPGGIASARSNPDDNPLKITVTGSGTFRLKPGNPHATGGGTWTTFAPDGTETGSGTYEVTGVVRFQTAPGTFPPGLNDAIGDPAEASAGLVVLTIAYSDGDEGTLVVSCSLVGTPESNFEGVTATKGSVGFWNREAPQGDPFVDANRTLFHVSP